MTGGRQRCVWVLILAAEVTAERPAKTKRNKP
jgi:hypothetical protein